MLKGVYKYRCPLEEATAIAKSSVRPPSTAAKSCVAAQPESARAHSPAKTSTGAEPAEAHAAAAGTVAAQTTTPGTQPTQAPAHTQQTQGYQASLLLLLLILVSLDIRGLSGLVNLAEEAQIILVPGRLLERVIQIL